MIRVILSLGLLIISVCTSLAQSIEDWGYLSIYSKDSLRLFDSDIVKKRNIKKAFVVRITPEIDRKKGHWLVNDTCFVYEFDERGVAIRRIDFHKFRSEAWTDTVSLPLKHERFQEYYSDSMITKNTLLPAGKIVTQYLFWKYQNKMDTVLTIKTKYNVQNKKVEEEIIPTKLYFKLIDCMNDQPPFRYKYGYDEKGRLNFYRDYSKKEYLSISYPSYGELINRFNATNNQLISQMVNTITQAEDGSSNTTTMTTSERQVVISKHKMEDNLISLVTIVQNSSFLGIKYYRFTYE